VLRGGTAAPASLVLAKAASVFRALGHMPVWQIVSPGPAAGTVGKIVVANIKDVQETTFTEPTVLVASAVTGEEEVPPGVVAVLTSDAPDILSHIVRPSAAPAVSEAASVRTSRGLTALPPCRLCDPAGSA
jgi:alpha-glucan,water dikinase